jgi:hypothetical protein
MLVFGPNTSILSLEVSTFLSEKGIFETIEYFGIISLFVCEEKPFLHPFYVSDWNFVIEVCKEYNSLTHFFNEKINNQFISLPWKVG